MLIAGHLCVIDCGQMLQFLWSDPNKHHEITRDHIPAELIKSPAGIKLPSLSREQGDPEGEGPFPVQELVPQQRPPGRLTLDNRLPLPRERAIKESRMQSRIEKFTPHHAMHAYIFSIWMWSIILATLTNCVSLCSLRCSRIWKHHENDCCWQFNGEDRSKSMLLHPCLESTLFSLVLMRHGANQSISLDASLVQYLFDFCQKLILCFYVFCSHLFIYLINSQKISYMLPL